MAVYSINLQKDLQAREAFPRWHLDLPEQGQNVDGALLNREGLLFQGWVLNESSSPIELVVLNGKDVVPLPFSRSRPDVITKVLNEPAEKHPQLYCGFSKRVILMHASFSLGIIKDGKFTQLLTGTIEGKFQILKGGEGWLFLNNDTNKSIEQHTGKFRLSRSVKAQWKEYLGALDHYSRSNEIPVCLLVAPSKEMVYQQYYPHKFSKKAPINKLMELVPQTLNFILPVKELRNLDYRSFRVCDTHWTLHGARIAAQLVTSKLSKKAIEELEVFESDVYQNRRVSGDLGSKLYPPQFHGEDSLISFNYRKTVIFDNNVDNFGRIICTFYEGALINETLLLFGSSSSYTMFHYVTRLYSTVVFVHTAGNIDHKVINKVKPDCICLQTNARFVVKAPNFNGSVLEYIEAKKKSKAIKPPSVAKTLPKESEAYIEYFRQMLDPNFQK